MKRCLPGLSFLVVTFLFGGCASTPPAHDRDPEWAGMPETTVHVLVRGLRSVEGQVRLVLFAGPDGFPNDAGKAVRKMQSAIKADSVEFSIENVAAGRYALSVLHDEDNDGRMATGMFGRPSEGYGFSQNARGTFGPPGFDDAMFEVLGEPVTLEIGLIYH